MAEEEQTKDCKTIRNIIDNYIQQEKSIVQQLYFKTQHGPTIGGFREEIWKGMFEQIIPKKFVIEQSVFILDSYGNVSNEVDLAIFDEMYTPYIFRFGKLKFLPIEAVAVVIECKSSSLNQENLRKWTESIAELKTSLCSYTRIFTTIVDGEICPSKTQTATRPLRILCCLNEEIVNVKLDSKETLFDLIIRAPNKEESLKIEWAEDKESLKEWYLALNHACDCERIDMGKSIDIDTGEAINKIHLTNYRVSRNNELVTLLTLNLQLNQLLMLINNPMLFPHKAYADMFNKYGMGGLG